jgi:Na+-driven multidrug efflux pump
MRKTSSAIRNKAVDLLNKHFSGNTLNYRQIIDIYVPILADTAFIVLMSMLNTAMVSSSGVAAVSAVSMVDSLNMFIVSLFVALATGGTVLVAQYKGSGNPRMVSSTASQAVSVETLIGGVISALLLIFPGRSCNCCLDKPKPMCWKMPGFF